MRMKLNQRVIERLATPDRETFIWHEDLEGFGVRMYPSGRTLYVVQYKQDGVTRRTTVGNAALVEFDDALSDARCCSPGPARVPIRSARSGRQGGGEGGRGRAGEASKLCNVGGGVPAAARP